MFPSVFSAWASQEEHISGISLSSALRLWRSLFEPALALSTCLSTIASSAFTARQSIACCAGTPTYAGRKCVYSTILSLSGYAPPICPVFFVRVAGIFASPIACIVGDVLGFRRSRPPLCRVLDFTINRIVVGWLSEKMALVTNRVPMGG